MTRFTTPLDPGIERFVETLLAAGVETYESCEGGPGHAFTEPTIRFYGQRCEGFRALSIALAHGFPVKALRRFWAVRDGEPTGPDWELVFWPNASPRARRKPRSADDLPSRRRDAQA